MPLVNIALSAHNASEISESRGAWPPVDIVIVPAIGIKDDALKKLLLNVSSEHLYGKFSARGAPDARILLLDYKITSTHSGQHILDKYAEHLLTELLQARSQLKVKNQIHFVGHSTGGLVVKKALVLAYQRHDYYHMRSCCSTLAFFGVPHKGSSILSEDPYAESVADLLCLNGNMPSELRECILPESDIIKIMYSDFMPIARGMQKIWTFVENEDSILRPLVNRDDATDELVEYYSAIVDARSAELRLGMETIVRVNRSHAELLTKPLTNSPNPLDEYVHDLQQLLTIMLQNNDDLDRPIKTTMLADLHLFHSSAPAAGTVSVKVWSFYPQLSDLLEHGPIKCMRAQFDRHGRAPNKLIASPKSSGKDSAMSNPLDIRQQRRPSTIQIPQVIPDGEDDSDEVPQIVIPESTPRANAMGQRQERNNASGIRFGATLQPHSEHSPSAVDSALRASHSSPNLLQLPYQASNRTDSSLGATLPTRLADRDDKGSIPAGMKLHLEQTHVETGRDNSKPVRFQLPDEKSRKFFWAHLPCNVMSWVPELMQQLVLHRSAPPLHETLLHEAQFDKKQNIARHGKPHSRYMSTTCKSFPISMPAMTRMTIFMPYLHWDTFQAMIMRGKLIDKCWEQKKLHPIDNDVRRSSSMEYRLIWQYLHSNANMPVHHRRTLDQFGYPHLNSTEARDFDQVVYKQRSNPQTRATSGKSFARWMTSEKTITGNSKGIRKSLAEVMVADNHVKVLMVDQLWCWIIDDTSILTMFTPKEDESSQEDPGVRTADLRDAILEDVKGDPRFATQCDTVHDFAALVVSHAVKVFIEDMPEKDLQVFRIFEEYINILTEHQIKSFKEFRDRYHNEGVYRSMGIKASKALSKLRETDLEANELDLTAVLELQDIQDELNTLDKLFEEQLGVVIEMAVQYQDKRSENGLKILEETKTCLETYRKKIADMLRQCKATQKAFSDLLDMKQRQGDVAEAWAAREANEVASGQSRAVLIFTIFTIIFLPLSFFTGLFGMNVRQWSGVSSNPPLHTVLLLMLPISAAVIVVTLLIAFNEYVRQSAIWLFTSAWTEWQRGKKQVDLEVGQLLHHRRKYNITAATQLVHEAGIMVGPLGYELKPFRGQTRWMGPKIE